MFVAAFILHVWTAKKWQAESVDMATHSKGSTMHSSVDVRQMILLPSSRSATTQTPSTGDSGLQQHTQTAVTHLHPSNTRNYSVIYHFIWHIFAYPYHCSLHNIMDLTMQDLSITGSTELPVFRSQYFSVNCTQCKLCSKYKLMKITKITVKSYADLESHSATVQVQIWNTSLAFFLVVTADWERSPKINPVTGDNRSRFSETRYHFAIQSMKCQSDQW